MRADIFGYHIQLIGRQEKLVASRVSYIDVISADTVDRKIFNSHILTYSVHLVDYEIPHVKVVIGHYALSRALFLS